MFTFKATEEEVIEMRESNDGACILCGQEVLGGIEPDARKYECESCGKNGVYGSEELFLMGYLKIEEEQDA